jgi:hypothetical protein
MHAALAKWNRDIREDAWPHMDDLMGLYMDNGDSDREGDAFRLLKVYSEHSIADPQKVEAHVSLILQSGADNVRVRGYLDLLADKKHPRVVDYKCPARAPQAEAARNSIQLTLYSIAAGTKTAELCHLFFKEKKPQILRQATRIDERRIQVASNFLAGQERAIRIGHERNHWPRRAPDHPCTNCYLRNVCWKGAENAKFEAWKEKFGDPDEGISV